MNRKAEKQFKIIIIIAAILAIVMAAHAFHLHRAFYNDDAFISLRYAQNLIDGNGLVWNSGERTEGYTNFFHIILTSFLGYLGIGLVTAQRMVNGIAFFMMIAVGLFHISRNLNNRPDKREWLMGLIPLILILNTYPIISWIFGGLEGPLFASLVTIGLLLIYDAAANRLNLRLIAVGSLSLVTACLTRPDGLIFAGASLIFLILISGRGSHPGRKPILIFLLPFVLMYLPYLIWRVSYYDNWLPLTFYVKASGFSIEKAISGLTYLYSYLITPPYILIILVAAVITALIKGWLHNRLIYLLSSIVLYCAFIIYIGGDYMYSFRLLLPVIPLAIILSFHCIKLFAKNITSGKTAILLVVLFMMVAAQHFQQGSDVRKMGPEDYVGTSVGKYISSTWPTGSLVALNTAGSTPYFAPQHRYIDMLGLNDNHIARREIKNIRLKWQTIPGHYKGDGAYVLSRQPDYVIVGPARGTIIDRPWFLSDLEMMEDPRFVKNYRMQTVRLDNCLFTYYERIK